jgi:hypothetical protein
MITGIGGILGAIATILTLVFGGGGDGANAGGGGGSGGTSAAITLDDWSEEANRICSEAYEDIRALGIPPDPGSQVAAIPQTSRIVTRTNQRLQALDRPEDGSDRIAKVLELASRANITARDLHVAWSANDTAAVQTLVQNYNGLIVEMRQLESEIGANVCAEGP